MERQQSRTRECYLTPRVRCSQPILQPPVSAFDSVRTDRSCECLGLSVPERRLLLAEHRGSLRFHEFVTNHVAEQDEPGVADGDDGYATSTKIGMLLLEEKIDEPLRDVEDYLNEMPGILDISGLDKSPDHTSFSNWDGEFPMQQLRGLLRASAEQAGLSGTASVDASGFQRDQTSSYYRTRAGYSFDATKTTLSVDTESLAIMDAHFTTKKPYDGHIGLQVFRRNAGDLHTLLADKLHYEVLPADPGASTTRKWRLD